MDKRVFDNAVIVFGEGSNRVELPGKVMLEITFEKARETWASMSFPPIGAVTGEMVIDTIEETLDSQEKPKRGGRQDAFGKFLRKGKRY